MDQIERIATGLIKKSSSGDTQKLTIADNKAQGNAQVCTSCLVSIPSSNSGTVYITIADRDANANDFPLPVNQVIPFPVEEVSNLHFYGITNGDVIHILWRD